MLALKAITVIMDVKHEIPWPKNCLRLSVYDGIPSKLAPNDVQSRLTAWSMRSMPSHNAFKWFIKSKYSYFFKNKILQGILSGYFRVIFGKFNHGLFFFLSEMISSLVGFIYTFWYSLSSTSSILERNGI